MPEYLPVLFFVFIAAGISLVMMGLPLVFNPTRADSVKTSPYECGFEEFDSARKQFDVRFYLVAILFIIFDLEIAFLFPWTMVFGDLGWFGFGAMMVFLGILTVGFIYEWKKGALEWE